MYYTVILQNKYRNKLNVEIDLRLQLYSFNPEIDSLSGDKQCEKSNLIKLFNL